MEKSVASFFKDDFKKHKGAFRFACISGVVLRCSCHLY